MDPLGNMSPIFALLGAGGWYQPVQALYNPSFRLIISFLFSMGLILHHGGDKAQNPKPQALHPKTLPQILHPMQSEPYSWLNPKRLTFGTLNSKNPEPCSGRTAGTIKGGSRFAEPRGRSTSLLLRRLSLSGGLEEKCGSIVFDILGFGGLGFGKWNSIVFCGLGFWGLRVGLGLSGKMGAT